MKMNKTLLAILAMSSVAGVAQAQVNLANADQSTLSLYGILDAGVVQMTNAGNISPNFVTGANPTGSNSRIGTVRGMMNGGESQSRWGIKGSEDLGDGNKAFFQLESAFNVASGNLATSGLAGGAGTPNMVADTALNGQLFNRMALIGVSNTDMGALSFGRHYSLALDVIGSIGGGYDPVNAQMFSPINFSGSYGGGGATDNSRVDSSIKYANKFGNINVNALYGMGGVAAASTARSNAQLNVGYEADAFGVQATAQQAKDTTGLSANAAPGTVNATFENLTSYMLAGRFSATEALTLKAGYERMQISAPSNYAQDALMTTIYSYNLGTKTAFTGAQRNLNVYWLGGNFQFTPKTKLSVGYYDIEVPSGTGTGANTVTTSTGSDKYLSAMVEYNLSKMTNVYAAMMLDKKSGSFLGAGTGAISTFNTYGAGLRIKF
jgi:GBP family porin